MFHPKPEPKSNLDKHRILSPNASVRVSPLCLGTMNFGDAWKDVLGECTKETAFAVLDKFYASGGNFVDTANNYQDEQSETWVGEWMAARGVRDQMVVATKFTTNYQHYRGHAGRINSNYAGNGAKSLRVSVEASLRKLQTSYIDVLYVHWYDHQTSPAELMGALNALVAAGQVLYLGASDMPAFYVAKCNEWARCHGLRPFAVYQGRWSAANRQFESDILALCEADGMAIAPWGVLGGGDFKTQAQRSEAGGRAKLLANPHAEAVSGALEKVAARSGAAATLQGVALAYVTHKAPYVFPIVGVRKMEHLTASIDALAITLDGDDLKEIEDAAPFELGFPFSLIGTHAHLNKFMNDRGNFAYVSKKFDVVDGGGHMWY